MYFIIEYRNRNSLVDKGREKGRLLGFRCDFFPHKRNLSYDIACLIFVYLYSKIIMLKNFLPN